jgi:CO dehydrogenase maturation factor
VLDILKEGGLELAGTVPADDTIYEFDLNGRPTIELPEDSRSVQAAFQIFQKIVK